MDPTITTLLFQGQSLCILLLLTLGIYFRKKTSLHIKLMTTTIIWDILLVLQIELSRNAVATAMKVVINPMILNIHITLAVSTVVLYFYQGYTGRKLMQNKSSKSIRSKHKYFGITIYTLRILTFITSFYAHQP